MTVKRLTSQQEAELLDLAASRRARAAEEALAAYDPTDTQEPALVRLDHAHALAQAGELAEACRVATTAVTDPHTYPSVTVRARATEFDRALGDGAHPAVQDWREALRPLARPAPLQGTASAPSPHS